MLNFFKKKDTKPNDEQIKINCINHTIKLLNDKMFSHDEFIVIEGDLTNSPDEIIAKVSDRGQTFINLTVTDLYSYRYYLWEFKVTVKNNFKHLGFYDSMKRPLCPHYMSSLVKHLISIRADHGIRRIT